MEEKEQESNGREPEGKDAHEEKPKDDAAELRERLLRLAAEFDNYKKRVAKDLDGSKEMGRADVISKLLPTVDEFELAMGSFRKDDEHIKGIELIFSNLMSTLKGFGLQEIDAKGRFDPYRHEIVLSQESDKKEGEIVEVVRKGYMLNSMMIRPASVIVSRNEAAKKEQKGE